MIDEANIETHGFDPLFGDDTNHPAHHELWLAALMSRVTRMYGRDKNSPAIISWSLGNESGYGVAHDSMAAWLRRADASRVVHYEVRNASAAARQHGSALTVLLCIRLPATFSKAGGLRLMHVCCHPTCTCAALAAAACRVAARARLPRT